ncbi:MAG: TIGR02266 family protein [Myxococcales bacterium]|nr:TIGR02266 family protein [Myxococcales bacterium]MDH3484111.1 TIGR02266 family protein [Myxococcales bacterium]
MADARTDKRTLLSLKIRYKSSTLQDFIERYSSDISRGGVFIKAKKPLAVGTLLKFEFLLQDQSTLIHGVGRVVWRRDPSEADAHNPSGMGIKFIKMDPDSRALVQRIAEGRESPGVYEQGERGQLIDTPVPSAASTPVPDDRTKVRHVSEFLASALEEGGAGEAATREAQAGARRARQLSHDIGANRTAAARGALGKSPEPLTTKRQAAPEAASRRAMSAFGNSNGSVSQAMAEPFEELDAEEDFLDNETTRIHDYPEADATVVAGASAVPFIPERRPTPVVPSRGSASRLESEVPDLFGPDMAASLGPSPGLEAAPGEFLDPSLLDPAVQTVPPPAGLPKGIGIPAEAFRLPTEPVPGGSIAAAKHPAKGRMRGSSWLFLVIVLAVVAGAGVAGWKLGIVEQLEELAAPYIGDEIEVFGETLKVPQMVAQKQGQADPEAAQQPEATVEEAPAEPAEAAADALAKLVIRSRPMGAFVSVDDKPAGRTPITLKFEPGTQVSLLARARGYLPKAQQVTVQAGSSTVSLALPTLPYYVMVVSDPPGARATAVGGGEVTTPGEMRFKSMLSARTITVSKDGYQTASKSLSRRDFREESSRMVTSVTVELQPEVAPAPVAEEPANEDPEPVEAAPAEAEPTPEPVEAEAAEAPDNTTETTAADSP